MFILVCSLFDTFLLYHPPSYKLLFPGASLISLPSLIQAVFFWPRLSPLFMSDLSPIPMPSLPCSTNLSFFGFRIQASRIQLPEMNCLFPAANSLFRHRQKFIVICSFIQAKCLFFSLFPLSFCFFSYFRISTSHLHTFSFKHLHF